MSDNPNPKPEIQYIPVPQGHYPYPDDDDEIDLIAMAKTVWEGRKLIGALMGVFFLFGLFHYLTGPEEFESEAILIQESTQPSVSANMRLLQQFGGISGGGGGTSDLGRLSPNIYPRIIESVGFQHNLLLNEVYFETLGESMTLYHYFIHVYEPPFRERFYRTIRNYTIRLPITLYRHVTSLFRERSEVEELDFVITEDGEILELNSQVRRAISEMRSRTNVEFDDSFINVNTRMPDARAAAQVNALLIRQIQDYVIDYRVEKARQDLQSIEQMYEESRERYDEAQRQLAQFQDENRGQMTALARIEQERLQNERSLTFGIYNSFAQRREDARLRLQEETPVFTQLQKPNLPHQPTSDSNLIIIIFTLLGAISAVGFIFTKKFWQENRHRFTE